MVPVMEVSGEPHGRLSGYILTESLERAESVLLQGLVLLTLVIVVTTLVDLIVRGRFRTIALTLAQMLAALGPLMGLYGAANVLVKASLIVPEPLMLAGHVGPAAMFVSVGALCGGIGVVLAAVLRLAPVKSTITPHPGQAAG